MGFDLNEDGFYEATIPLDLVNGILAALKARELRASAFAVVVRDVEADDVSVFAPFDDPIAAITYGEEFIGRDSLLWPHGIPCTYTVHAITNPAGWITDPAKENHDTHH